jgi:hypothetical protein
MQQSTTLDDVTTSLDRWVTARDRVTALKEQIVAAEHAEAAAWSALKQVVHALPSPQRSDREELLNETAREKVPCPHCGALFFPRGLGPHLARMHPNAAREPSVNPSQPRR